MIVHEALPRRKSAVLETAIEHRFYRDGDELRQKQRFYALLWALRAHRAGRRSPFGARVRQPLHWVRNALLKGALWRGGLAASDLAWVVGEQHALKYHFLDALHAGGFEECVSTFARGDLSELFGLVRDAVDRFPSPRVKG